MGASAFDEYKASWEKAHTERAFALERRRAEALAAARRLSHILGEEFGASRVVLFGSVLEPGRFHEDSDIDLAVEGLPAERYFEALGRLFQETSFDVDLVPVVDARGSLKERIVRGAVLHEKRATS